MPAEVSVLSAPQPFRFPDARELPEPQLLFAPRSRDAVHVHPLRGLTEYGPYSSEVPGAVRHVMRIATIAPPGQRIALQHLLSGLRERHPKRTRSDYLIDYPGIEPVFRIDLDMAEERSHVNLPRDLPDRLATKPKPHLLLASCIGDALRAIRETRTDYDLVWLYVPENLSAGFYGTNDDPFDLHDFVKGTSASLGVPTQVLNEPTVGGTRDMCSVAWTLALACYAKAGGTPYKVNRNDDGTAFLGIAYALRKLSDKTTFVTCCAQVFDAEGSCLEFLAYEMPVDSMEVTAGNPYLERNQIRTVVSRAVGLYADRHSGRHPSRMVVHKTTPFRKREIAGCADALKGVPDVQLVQLQQETPWRAIRYDGSRVPGFPVYRGTLLHADGPDALLWTQGAVDEISARNSSYYKEGVGIPKPLLLRRWAGRGPAEPLAAEVLALTKMDWNSETLYSALPVTISYAQKVAQTLRTAPTIGPIPYSYKYFI